MVALNGLTNFGEGASVVNVLKCACGLVVVSPPSDPKLLDSNPVAHFFYSKHSRAL